MSSSTPEPPSGFFSYRHLDGADRKYVERFWQNLKDELFTLTGLHIKLWRDVDEIEWGKEWGKAIDAGLADAAFFLPVITPGYLLSEACRDEFEKVASYEKKRKRTDLILPLVYVRPDSFGEDGSEKRDPIVKLCLKRQYADWEDLRHVGDEQREYRTKLTELGKRIRALLKSVDAPTVSRKSGEKKTAAQRSRANATTSRGTKNKIVPSAQEPGAAPQQKELYVNRLGQSGTYQTIAKALEAAQGGERIFIAPGHYHESIQITKPVEIHGEGNLGDVTIEVKGTSVVRSIATFGRIQNVALRQNGGEQKGFAVSVAAGGLDIVGCEITSADLSCVVVSANAEVRVRRCRIHGSPQAGVAFFKDARGIVEECDLFDHGAGCVELIGCIDVVVRGNKMHDTRSSGVSCSDAARGLIEDNDISATVWAGVTVSAKADPLIRRNRVHDGKAGGIFIFNRGAGTVTENKIFGNAYTGIEIRDESAPSLSKNHVHHNKQTALYFHTGGAGIAEENRIEANGGNGLTVKDGAKPQVRRNRFVSNVGFGVHVKAGGGGVIDENNFEGNEKGDQHISSGAIVNPSPSE